MDTNKMRDLKALAETCLPHQPLRFMRSHGALYIRNDNGIVFDVHQNRSFPDLMAQNKDYADFALACTPATVLALLAEVDRLATSRSKKERELEQELEVWHHGPFCWTCGDTGHVHDITGEWRGECDCLAAQLIKANRERDQLKAENEALRKLKLPHYLKLSDEMRAAGEHAEQRAREDQCYSVPVLKAVFFEAAIQRWLDDQEEAIDAALAGEASRD